MPLKQLACVGDLCCSVLVVQVLYRSRDSQQDQQMTIWVGIGISGYVPNSRHSLEQHLRNFFASNSPHIYIHNTAFSNGPFMHLPRLPHRPQFPGQQLFPPHSSSHTSASASKVSAVGQSALWNRPFFERQAYKLLLVRHRIFIGPSKTKRLV